MLFLQNEGPKGQFAVEQIKVAEAMEKEIFGKEWPYSFQVRVWPTLPNTVSLFCANRDMFDGHYK